MELENEVGEKGLNVRCYQLLDFGYLGEVVIKPDKKITFFLFAFYFLMWKENGETWNRSV